MSGRVANGGPLTPGIVQHATSGEVLMLGYLNEESLELTRATGEVHFWSRSRDALWRKGETSGNTLKVIDIRPDCDADALLIRALPAGPVCHTGASGCFADPTPADRQGFSFLEDLWETIKSRAIHRPPGSYTAQIIANGVDAAARKVVEEATELLIAAKDHAAGCESSARLSEEAADLMYHLLVLLAERDVEPARAIDVLESRAG